MGALIGLAAYAAGAFVLLSLAAFIDNRRGVK